ncbi:Uncharacterized protein APZ42_032437 [Daphnia magna]|uniref:Uncharacterized protein n=1 Tax=Daphnia magna TaxID=35525 RepID=A0A164LZX0_9CRUS|nr:Uncharacterized protein APZ42_032437 [Daphnia magna]
MKCKLVLWSEIFLDDVFLASFREIFKLIDCSMLLKRKEDQPGQSMKEISQLLHSLKKSNEFHHAEVENLMQPDETDNFVVQEQELVEDLLPQPEKMLFNQAQASIKFAEIRHLQMVLNDALRYLKYLTKI